MVGHCALIIVCSFPDRTDRRIDILEDLLRGLFCPGSVTGSALGHGGLHRIRVIDQAGGVVLFKADIGVLIQVLIIAHTDAVGEESIQAAAHEVGAHHVPVHHTQGSGKGVGLVHSLGEGSLYHRDAIGSTGLYGSFAGAAGHAIAHGHGAGVIGPAAAHIDDNVTGIGKVVERFADIRVALLQLRHQKGVAARHCCGIKSGHTGHALWGLAAADDTGVKSSDIYKAHIMSSLCVLHGQDPQLGGSVGIRGAAPLAVGQLHSLCLVRLCFKAAHCCGTVTGIGGDADIHLAAQGRRTALTGHIDRTALEHRDGVTGGILAGALLQVGQRALDLCARYPHKLGGHGGCTHLYNGAGGITVIDQRGAERDGDLTAAGAGVCDHVGLSGVAAGKAVGHFFSNGLRSDSCHLLLLLLHVGVAGGISRLHFTTTVGVLLLGGGGIIGLHLGCPGDCAQHTGHGVALHRLEQGVHHPGTLPGIPDGGHGGTDILQDLQGGVPYLGIGSSVVFGHSGRLFAILSSQLFDELFQIALVGHLTLHLLLPVILLRQLAQHGKDLVQLAAEIVVPGHLLRHLIGCGCCLLRLCGGFGVQRSLCSGHKLLQFLRACILGRLAQSGQDHAVKHVHTLPHFLCRRCGGVLY
nr:MAG TPA: hypothetical protein [Caudoviricetes sp.]